MRGKTKNARRVTSKIQIQKKKSASILNYLLMAFNGAAAIFELQP